MATDELSLFSYEILGLVGSRGAGAHDLLRMAQRGRFLDWAGESQYYVEPKRLAKLGYLQARREPGVTRERTVYSLTEKGRQALSEWAQTPASFTPIKSEALTRLLIADLVGDEATVRGLGPLRDDIAELQGRLEEISQHAVAELPHRSQYLEIVYRFIARLLELHLELVDEAEAVRQAERA